MEYRGMKVVYRRYASLFFIVGVEAEEEVRQLAHAAAPAHYLPPPPLTPKKLTRYPPAPLFFAE